MSTKLLEKTRLKWVVPLALMALLLVTVVLFKIIPVGTAYAPVDDFGEPVLVRKGISVTPQADGKLSDAELQEFIDEYGEDANIIIYEVGH